MKYTLPPLEPLVPGADPNLREELARRRPLQRDFRPRGSDARLDMKGGRVILRCGSEEYVLTAGACAFLSERVGLGGRVSSPEALDRIGAWLDAQGEVLVRLEQGRVRAILPGEIRLVDTLELLDRAVEKMAQLPVPVRIEHCEAEDGELYLTAVAPDLAREMSEGDYLYGGFFLATSETTLMDTEASVRIYRVACANGALVDAAEGQRLALPRVVKAGEADPYAGWEEKLDRVIARSFDGGDLGTESRRFRATANQILATPYELLLHLRAQDLISEEEQARIQRAFNEGRDESMFALINAVTQTAHHHRDRDDWARAFAIERLGGEILRGDHQPPVLDPVLV